MTATASYNRENPSFRRKEYDRRRDVLSPLIRQVLDTYKITPEVLAESTGHKPLKIRRWAEGAYGPKTKDDFIQMKKYCKYLLTDIGTIDRFREEGVLEPLSTVAAPVQRQEPEQVAEEPAASESTPSLGATLETLETDLIHSKERLDHQYGRVEKVIRVNAKQRRALEIGAVVLTVSLISNLYMLTHI